ncbi:MAG: hypothetical protein ABJC61_06365 [Acidobacteriota bacterium]
MPRKPEPWKQPNPRGEKGSGKGARKLTPAQKAKARRSAKQAGRPYPNLVDNMHAKTSSRAAGGKKAAAKTR